MFRYLFRINRICMVVHTLKHENKRIKSPKEDYKIRKTVVLDLENTYSTSSLLYTLITSRYNIFYAFIELKTLVKNCTTNLATFVLFILHLKMDIDLIVDSKKIFFSRFICRFFHS